jgi:hypothetical protein
MQTSDEEAIEAVDVIAPRLLAANEKLEKLLST